MSEREREREGGEGERGREGEANGKNDPHKHVSIEHITSNIIQKHMKQQMCERVCVNVVCFVVFLKANIVSSCYLGQAFCWHASVAFFSREHSELVFSLTSALAASWPVRWPGGLLRRTPQPEEGRAKQPGRGRRTSTRSKPGSS